MRTAPLTLLMATVVLTTGWSLRAAEKQAPTTRPTTQAATQPTTRPLDEKTKAEVLKLIRQLGDDSFEVREAATKRLIEIGAGVVPMVEDAGKISADPEVQERCKNLLRALVRPPTGKFTVFDADTGLTVKAGPGPRAQNTARVWAERDGGKVWETTVATGVESLELDGATVILQPAGWVLNLRSGQLISAKNWVNK